MDHKSLVYNEHIYIYLSVEKQIQIAFLLIHGSSTEQIWKILNNNNNFIHIDKRKKYKLQRIKIQMNRTSLFV